MITWALNYLGRLADWLRSGTWCQHDRFGPWYLIDLGREKIRHCERCGWMETTNHPWQGLFRRAR
jgi:hypothetical protein